MALDFGHVIKAVGTFVNKIAGAFGGTSGEPTAEDEQEGDAEVFDSEHWSHYGFESRPQPEDDKGRCEVIFSRDENITICTKDRRFRINLKDGEVALYSGKDGEVKCKQVLKPDGTMVMSGKNLGVMVKKDGGEGGEVVLGAEKSLTLARTKGTSSLITIKEDGGIQAVTAGGSTMTLEESGKALIGAGNASVVLDGTKAIVNAAQVSLVGSVGVGVHPKQLPVATIGCMAGIFPILQGSFLLKAQRR